jgi:sialate O-acetylesterase
MKEGKKNHFIEICVPFKPRIHPRDKLDVGYRLSQSGLAVAYGFKNVTYQGPVIADISVSSDSSKINVTYSKEISTSVELRNPAGFEVYLIFIYSFEKISL